jgi:isoleucyl-tRNA synthetase
MRPNLEGKFDPKQIEGKVRQYLGEIDILRLVQEEVKGGEMVGFIEGPPTMNGEPHIGHTRGRVIKDLWYRHNTMRRKNVLFRAGWDSQGLPVELQAEKELGLTGSKAENLKTVGIEKIVETCKKIIHEYNQKWVAADKMLGMSMDYKSAYWTYRDSYIEREWQYLKKAFESGILEKGYRIVPYCPSCQTSLSNTEVGQGYEMVEDPSLYYKVKLADEEAYLLVWTTMPFTLVTDEMVGVNPSAEYAYAQVGDETWVISKDRIEPLMKELKIDGYSPVKTVTGKELEGKKYVHPFLDLIPGLGNIAKRASIHVVVAEDYVDITTGTGLVHLAPANGQDDFRVAKERGLPIFAPIDDRVVFTEGAGVFKDYFVRDADNLVVDHLRERGALVKIGRTKHSYPTCWRSHHKLVWLARMEYFYMIEKLGDKPIEAAQAVEYFYEQPKNRFLEIIREKVPWCISRERVWGTPLPIWRCGPCDIQEPVFSRQEIISRATELPDGPEFELHRPWIDRVVIHCNRCKRRMDREPFVLDTWHNSGAAPFASMTDEQYHTLIPATFLTEAIDQTRGWAYTLLMENVMFSQGAEAPFKSFLFSGHVLDEKGNKMSKSRGNVLSSLEVLTKYPVDLVRFYLMWKSSPVETLNFDPKEMMSRPYQVLSTLYNLHVYFMQNSSYDKFDMHANTLEWAFENKLAGQKERWLLSKLQRLIKSVSTDLDACRFHEAAKSIDEFIINQLSQTYVPVARNELWDDSEDNRNRRMAIYAVLSYVLKKVDILLHPLCPFTTDHLYLACYGERESIVLEKWPDPVDGYVDEEIEKTLDALKEIASLANSARMKARLKRRWPLKEAHICIKTPDLRSDEIMETLRSQINVEECKVVHVAGPNYQLITDMLQNNIPVEPEITLRTKQIAPLVQGDLHEVLASFSRVDKKELFSILARGEEFGLRYGEKQRGISADLVDVSYKAKDGFELAENSNFIVLISTRREEALIAQGLMRDVARNIQQLRKERNFNPNDMLKFAHVFMPDKQDFIMLENLKTELAYLVRVNEVSLHSERVEGVAWKDIEIDGKQFTISVE